MVFHITLLKFFSKKKDSLRQREKKQEMGDKTKISAKIEKKWVGKGVATFSSIENSKNKKLGKVLRFIISS
jgi:hypothetical protein